MNLNLTCLVALGALGFVSCEIGDRLRRDLLRNFRRDEPKIEKEVDSSFEEAAKRKKTLSETEEKSENANGRRTGPSRVVDVGCAVGEAKDSAEEDLFRLCDRLKIFGFRYFDRLLQDDSIPLTESVYLVRDGIDAATSDDLLSHENRRPKPEEISKKSLRESEERILNEDWTALLYDRIDNLFKTHSVKFRLGQTHKTQGRGRRRDHRMFAMMVMGFMIMASILIPMGFQFLTVLGGKSLLMAKMALIMSAINGLKKIATSNVGYGFYHGGSDAHHHDHLHHGFHDKFYHANAQGAPTQYGFGPA